ncbi:MAG TPA: cation transporter, partial [bacterium]|nr:cation transporter [bacterium]
GCHHLRTRSLGRYVTVDAHILVDPEMSVRDSHTIATDTENAVRKALGNAAFVTIHVEPGNRD